MDPEDPATPCGLVAKSLFNDHFDFSEFKKDGEGDAITVLQDNIAWETDKLYKFNNVGTKDGSDKIVLPENSKTPLKTAGSPTWEDV